MKKATLERINRTIRAARRARLRAEPLLRYLEQLDDQRDEALHHVKLLVQHFVLRSHLKELKESFRLLSAVDLMGLPLEEVKERRNAIELAEIAFHQTDTQLEQLKRNLPWGE